MIDQKNYGIPQLETFSPLLKLKLAISVIYDCIRLLMIITAIGAVIAYGYWVYTQIPWEQVTPKQTQIAKQHKQ